MPGSRALAVTLVASASVGGAICATVCAPGNVRADGMVVVGGSPRAVGRAGADTVGDDGGGALLVDPAALARRDVARVQVGLSFIDDNVTWQPDDVGAPVARGQIGSIAVPLVAFELGVGDWVIGVGGMTAAVSDRSLTRPDLPPTAFGTQFEYRYAGLGGGVRRDTLTGGAARRLGDEVAVGFALGASRVQVAETRDVWAGFAGIHPHLGDPRDDITLALTGEDRFVPSAVGGLMLAPEDTPLELAVSVSWSGPARLEADVASAETEGGPRVARLTPHAKLDLAQPWTIRTGARYAGERWIAELDGDLWVFPSTASHETWSISGILVQSRAVEVHLTDLPSRLAPKTHGAVRGAVDFALMPGFLWLTAGYAVTTPGTGGSRLSPTFADLGGHTFAFGLEANAGGLTVTLGVSRTYALAQHPDRSDFRLDNPFNASDTTIPLGSYGGTTTQVGVLIDAELGGSK